MEKAVLRSQGFCFDKIENIEDLDVLLEKDFIFCFHI